MSHAGPGDYSFTAFDGNIEIVRMDVTSGSCSRITLVGVAGAGMVMDESSAEAAVGHDFLQYA